MEQTESSAGVDLRIFQKFNDFRLGIICAIYTINSSETQHQNKLFFCVALRPETHENCRRNSFKKKASQSESNGPRWLPFTKVEKGN